MERIKFSQLVEVTNVITSDGEYKVRIKSMMRHKNSIIIEKIDDESRMEDAAERYFGEKGIKIAARSYSLYAYYYMIDYFQLLKE